MLQNRPCSLPALASTVALAMLFSLPAHAASPPAPATASTTQPANRYTVKLGHLNRIIHADGMLTGIDSLVVRLRPKFYSGPFTILSAAPDGAQVKKGDTLLKLDDAEINRQIAAAQIDLTTANAASQKADADVELGGKSDQLALAAQQTQLTDAQAALQWWKTVDGPHMLKAADMDLENYQANVDDQQDELDQLKKMYKTDELTNATEDIVVKRAVRALAMGKEALQVSKENNRKTHQLTFPEAALKVQDAVDQAALQLDQAKAAQALALAQRTAAQSTAHAALDTARRHLADLQTDAKDFVIAAPFDGTLMYGGLADGAWQGGGADALRPAEKAQPGTPLMTLYVPGKLQAVVEVPAAQSLWVAAGMAVDVAPNSATQTNYAGKAGAIHMVGRPNTPSPVYELTVTLGPVATDLHPGLGVSAAIDAGQPAAALVIPLTALHHGTVELASADGKVTQTSVKVGESNATSVVVLSGLHAGDQIVVDGDK